MSITSLGETAGDEPRLAARLTAVQGDLRRLAEGFDPETLRGSDAACLVEHLASIEHLAASLKALCAARVERCGAWKADGDRSAASWLARKTGTAPSAAGEELATGRRVAQGPPELQDAYKRGRLSGQAASAISTATEVAPDAAAGLLNRADRDSFRELRDACRAVHVSASRPADSEARVRRLHAQRYMRRWIDTDGAGRIDARVAPDVYARIDACLRPFEKEQFDQARRQGRRERPEAYSADALLALAIEAGNAEHTDAGKEVATSAGAGTAPAALPTSPPAPAEVDKGAAPRRKRPADAQIIAVVSHSALVRGHTEGEETCWIEGVGPVPVSTVQAMLGDSVLSAVVSDGVDIRSVVHLGRYATATQRTALIARDRCCVVPGCGIRHGLEIDHVTGWTKTHVTTLDDLARLCHHHHHLKTHEHWKLTGGPGRWQFTPPTAQLPNAQSGAPLGAAPGAPPQETGPPRDQGPPSGPPGAPGTLF